MAHAHEVQPNLLHEEIPHAYNLPRLKLLPIREQPAFRVAKDSDACNLAELLVHMGVSD
jgi:DNA repair protein RadC